MQDGLFPVCLAHLDDFRKRHQRAVRRAHAHGQQLVDRRLVAGRQAQAHGHRVAGVAIHQVGGIVTGQRHAQDLGDAGLVEAKSGGAHAIDDDDLARRVGLDAGVDVDNVGLGAEFPLQCQCGLAHAVVIRAIDLGDDGREHRRAGRHFDQFHRCPVRLADRGQLRTHGQRDGMALPVSLVLVDQVDLQVADQWSAAQVVLAHQAVEGDRSGAAGVALPVAHFSDIGEAVGELAEQLVGAFERAAFRHVDDDLEFRFVVERQHLQDDRLDHHQANRGHDQHAHRRKQQAPPPRCPIRFEERRHELVRDAVEPAAARVLACSRVIGCRRVAGEQAQCEPGRDDEGDRQRQQHADRGIDRDRPHVRPHQAGDEGHRQQRGNHREGGEDGRPAHFADRRRDDLAQACCAEALVAVDVLDDDDGIVDEDADGEDQRKQGDAVDGETHCPGGEQGKHEGDDDGGADHHGFAPAEREQHQQDHRQRREHELLDQLVGLVAGSLAIVARGRKLYIGRNHDTAQRLQARGHGGGDVGGVAAGLLGNGQGHGGCIAAGRPGLAGGRAVPDIAARQVGTAADLRDIREEYRLALVEADDQRGDIGGIGEEAAHRHRHAAVLDDAHAGLAHRVGRAQGAGKILD